MRMGFDHLYAAEHSADSDRDAMLRRYGNQYLPNIGRKLVCRYGNAEGNRVLVGRLGRN